MTDLVKKHCTACDAKTPPLSPGEVKLLLGELDGWSTSADGTKISRTFRFDDFHETMAFVNALAFISHREDHHPDLEVSYGSVNVNYSTHAIRGLSENDFICAAKVDALLSDA
jgi:4a-hydroxytetrahydrobiopterin dehydratase